MPKHGILKNNQVQTQDLGGPQGGIFDPEPTSSAQTDGELTKSNNLNKEKVSDDPDKDSAWFEGSIPKSGAMATSSIDPPL
jgi:hypothetical protein